MHHASLKGEQKIIKPALSLIICAAYIVNLKLFQSSHVSNIDSFQLNKCQPLISSKEILNFMTITDSHKTA